MKKKLRIFIPGAVLLCVLVLGVCVLFTHGVGAAHASPGTMCPYYPNNVECNDYSNAYDTGVEAATIRERQTGYCPTNYANDPNYNENADTRGYDDGWDAMVEGQCTH